MSTTPIICPQCRKRYTIKAQNLSAISGQRFQCPKCGYATTIGAMLRSSAGGPPNVLKTHIAGGQAKPVGGTQVVSRNNIVTLVVESTGMTFPLSQGVYTLGRQSSDSRASLQIAPDRYMSRLQANLEVSMLPTGAMCRIMGVSSTNRIFVNNREIEPNSAAVLKNGDSLLLGMTKVLVRM